MRTPSRHSLKAPHAASPFAAGLLLLAATFAHAAPPAPANILDRLRPLIAQLDDDVLTKREQAQNDIAASESLHGRTAVQVLSDSSLSPEQRERLMQIAYDTFSRRPRAALGVSFDQFAERVSLSGTVPGFDAQRVLRGGDVIVRFNGVEVATQDDARREILSYEPGQSISLHVLRGEEAIIVRCTLGSYNELNTNRRQMTEYDLRRAFHAWLDRENAEANPRQSISSGRNADSWGEALYQEGISARGGRLKPPVDVELPAEVNAGGGERRTLNADAAQPFADSLDQLRLDTLSRMRQQEQVAEARIRNLEMQLRAGNLDAARRQQIELSIKSQKANLENLRLRMQQLLEQR